MKNDFKACPVCHSLCFSDMDTCYGCLHRFDDTHDVSCVESSLLDEAFELEEPSVPPLPGVPVGSGKGVVGLDSLLASPKGEEADCYELGLTVRIPREFLRALSACK